MPSYIKTCKLLSKIGLALAAILLVWNQIKQSEFAFAEESKGQTVAGPQDPKQPPSPTVAPRDPSQVLENKVPLKTTGEKAPEASKTIESEVKSKNADNTPQSLQLIALLTEDGQTIEKGLIWRVFEEDGTEKPPSEPLVVDRAASPVVRLKPGNYIVNVAYGRAHLTRRITISSSPNITPAVEKFVVNAGGLKVTALLSGKPAPAGSVSYAIYTDRDQSDERRLIVGSVKTGVVMRLNAGIYYIESIYGDANAAIRSDVTVEAGKLTEVTMSHSFAKVSFKLVTRSGGDALPNTQWTIQTPDGNLVKESVGALPAHTLAPGAYTVIARNQDRAFKKDFTVKDGQNQEIEILLQ